MSWKHQKTFGQKWVDELIEESISLLVQHIVNMCTWLLN